LSLLFTITIIYGLFIYKKTFYAIFLKAWNTSQINTPILVEISLQLTIVNLPLSLIPVSDQCSGLKHTQLAICYWYNTWAPALEYIGGGVYIYTTFIIFILYMIRSSVYIVP
jgi:hypothetical protein